MKLLIPIDGSPASLNALKNAVEIASQYHFSGKIISVADVNNIPGYSRNQKLWSQVDGSMIAGSSKEIQENDHIRKMKENTQKTMEDAIAQTDFKGIVFEKAVIAGDPAEEILKIAEKEEYDLIVMGNRGFSKVKRFFVGSVTQKVISEAPCPVLAIHYEI